MTIVPLGWTNLTLPTAGSVLSGREDNGWCTGACPFQN